jgi:uncharacterized protein (UPF0276 family)
LIDRYAPESFSEHLAWSSHGGVFLDDLLPLPYDRDSLSRVCAHVDQVQTRLGRRMLLENPATYVEFAASTFTEAEFIGEVVARTGCGLLLDVNNAYVSGVNHGRDPWACIEALPSPRQGRSTWPASPGTSMRRATRFSSTPTARPFPRPCGRFTARCWRGSGPCRR